MKKILFSLFFTGAALSAQAQNPQIITGDAQTACYVILCLAGGTNVSECKPPLAKYFSIHGKKVSDTVKKSKNFLDRCPTGNINAVNDAQMESLRTVISQLENDCSAETLNATLVNAGEIDGQDVYSITPTIPSKCQSLYNHAFRNSEAKLPFNTCRTDERYTREGWKTGKQVYYYYGFGTPRPHIYPLKMEKKILGKSQLITTVGKNRDD